MEVFTLPEPDGFYPRILQKNMAELMSELGVILGKSWSVNKHLKAGKGQVHSVSKNRRQRLIEDFSISQLIFK